MNSQQELLDAINTITQSKDRSCDAPATVLRVDGETVWVHFDGGADETPVRKTVNCEEGETVQVRIANGSAFLVGNESAPPTDDKTANVAHFVAVEADEKATEAIETANAIVQTVQGKVDSGNSNVTDLSSTMYQNAYGVNIYNDTLAVGDSYAHIDGDSFDIKQATTAGTIDDVNDTVLASFGANETVIQNDENHVTLTPSIIKIGVEDDLIGDSGWQITASGLKHYGNIYSGNYIEIDTQLPDIVLSYGNASMTPGVTDIKVGEAYFGTQDMYGSNIGHYTTISGDTITCFDDDSGALPGEEPQTIISGGTIEMTGDVYDHLNGYKKTPTVLTSSTISASATSYTFSDASIKADSVIDIYDTIFNFNATNAVTVNGSCTITFPAQSSSHTIKLFVY